MGGWPSGHRACFVKNMKKPDAVLNAPRRAEVKNPRKRIIDYAKHSESLGSLPELFGFALIFMG